MPELVVAVFVAVLGSNGLWGLIQHRMAKKDDRNDRLKVIEKAVQALSDKVDEHNAVLARTHILRFSDELQNGIVHSREYFRQQLMDIDTYDQYCEHHPDFQNSYAVIASMHIKTVYERLLENGEFAQGGDQT